MAGAQSADRYFTSDGVRLRYRDEGRGPAVILVHGWTLDLEMWGPQLTALSRRFRVVRLDRRGFGLSSGRPALDGDVADLGALCRHLDLGRVALVGMSQGARSVLAFDAAAPERVSCLVLDGPPDIDSRAAAEEDVPVARYRALLRSKGVEAVRREWAKHPLAQLRSADAGAHGLLSSMLGRYRGADLVTAPVSAGAAPGPIRPESVARPVLIITGEHDLPGRVKAADALARRLPHTERAVIPGAGHLPNLDNPDAYNNLVGAFLARHATALT
jgi:pimeloyl-[acyl-carrier protein] methyl ester esterase